MLKVQRIYIMLSLKKKYKLKYNSCKWNIYKFHNILFGLGYWKKLKPTFTRRLPAIRYISNLEKKVVCIKIQDKFLII